MYFLFQYNIGVPAMFELKQNFPNPFNPSTSIQFTIPNVASSFSSSFNATLKVYNILGEEIAELLNEPMQSGVYNITFNGEGLNGGVYFYRLRAGDFVDTKKMMLLG